MKNIFCSITFLILPLIGCSQTNYNELTTSDYYNIKINGVTFQSIYDTNGDETSMKVLFGSDLMYQYENDILILKDFWKTDLYYFSFDSPEGNYFAPLYIDVSNSLIIVTVKGINVKIGNHKNVFGNDIIVNINTNSIIFTNSDTGTESLAFKIDPSTNRIIAIEFDAF